MNIPHSTIEPFGVLGFPMPMKERHMTIELIEAIMTVLDMYMKEYMEVNDDSDIDPTRLRMHLQEVAVRHGADWASSKAIWSRVMPGRYVFVITYGFLNSTEEHTHVLSTAKF